VNEVVVMQHHKNQQWQDEELDELSRNYMVSREVILRRLLNLGIATQTQYQQKRDEWQAYFESDEYLQSKQSTSGGPPYHTKFVRHFGGRYVATVFEAYNAGRITIRDVAGFLNTQTRHLSNIEADLRRTT
jgi:Zn-dependent peptidase ImmA (M78 family)